MGFSALTVIDAKLPSMPMHLQQLSHSLLLSMSQTLHSPQFVHILSSSTHVLFIFPPRSIILNKRLHNANIYGILKKNIGVIFMAKGSLDEKLSKVLAYLNTFMDENGYPPSVREIGKSLNIKSTATVYYYISKLEDMGLVKKSPSKNRAIEVVSRANRKLKEIPLVGRVQAGTPILAVENIEESLCVSDGLFRGDELFMLTVNGDSMIEAGIFEGDKIIVNRQSHANNGDIVVALIDCDATVKRFFRKNGKIVLHPENSTMQDMVFDNVDILGAVKGLIRNI